VVMLPPMLARALPLQATEVPRRAFSPTRNDNLVDGVRKCVKTLKLMISVYVAHSDGIINSRWMSQLPPST
jgi:hypothetical protein